MIVRLAKGILCNREEEDAVAVPKLKGYIRRQIEYHRSFPQLYFYARVLEDVRWQLGLSLRHVDQFKR
jgi:hypothetical protein